MLGEIPSASREHSYAVEREKRKNRVGKFACKSAIGHGRFTVLKVIYANEESLKAIMECAICIQLKASGSGGTSGQPLQLWLWK